jgi:hypothetical protein
MPFCTTRTGRNRLRPRVRPHQAPFRCRTAPLQPRPHPECRSPAIARQAPPLLQKCRRLRRRSSRLTRCSEGAGTSRQASSNLMTSRSPRPFLCPFLCIGPTYSVCDRPGSGPPAVGAFDHPVALLKLPLHGLRRACWALKVEQQLRLLPYLMGQAASKVTFAPHHCGQSNCGSWMTIIQIGWAPLCVCMHLRQGLLEFGG